MCCRTEANDLSVCCRTCHVLSCLTFTAALAVLIAGVILYSGNPDYKSEFVPSANIRAYNDQVARFTAEDIAVWPDVSGAVASTSLHIAVEAVITPVASSAILECNHTLLKGNVPRAVSGQYVLRIEVRRRRTSGTATTTAVIADMAPTSPATKFLYCSTQPYCLRADVVAECVNTVGGSYTHYEPIPDTCRVGRACGVCAYNRALTDVTVVVSFNATTGTAVVPASQRDLLQYDLPAIKAPPNITFRVVSSLDPYLLRNSIALVTVEDYTPWVLMVVGGTATIVLLVVLCAMMVRFGVTVWARRSDSAPTAVPAAVASAAMATVLRADQVNSREACRAAIVLGRDDARGVDTVMGVPLDARR